MANRGSVVTATRTFVYKHMKVLINARVANKVVWKCISRESRTEVYCVTGSMAHKGYTQVIIWRAVILWNLRSLCGNAPTAALPNANISLGDYFNFYSHSLQEYTLRFVMYQ